MDNRSGLSSLGTNVHVAQSMRNALSHQAEEATTAARSQAHAYSDSLSSAMRNLTELNQHKDTSLASSNSSVISTSAGVTESLNNLQQLTDRFAKEHNMSHEQAGKFLMSAHGGLGLNASFLKESDFLDLGINVGGSLSASRDWTRRHAQVYSDAQNFVRDTTFGHNVEVVERGIKEHSFRANNEEGQRLLNNVSNSFDHADQVRGEMMSNLQKAESYREQAGHVEEKAASIDIQASQSFVAWLSKQPGMGNTKGRMSMRDIDDITSGKDTELSQYYADRYVQANMTHLLGTMPNSSAAKVEKTYHNNNADIPNEQAIVNRGRFNNEQVEHKASNCGLSKLTAIDRTAEKKASELINSNINQIKIGKDNVEEVKTKVIDKVKDETEGWW